MSEPPFDLDAVRALAALLTEAGLSEVEISGKDGRIRLARQLAPAPTVALPAPLPAAAQTAGGAGAPEHPGTIKSPMVGIAYLASEPSAPPFVTAGQPVEAGQTLLLIEAMKTFNQIKAPKSGTITRILVRSGTPVEYGEALMILE